MNINTVPCRSACRVFVIST